MKPKVLVPVILLILAASAAAVWFTVNGGENGPSVTKPGGDTSTIVEDEKPVVNDSGVNDYSTETSSNHFLSMNRTSDLYSQVVYSDENLSFSVEIPKGWVGWDSKEEDVKKYVLEKDVTRREATAAVNALNKEKMFLFLEEPEYELPGNAYEGIILSIKNSQGSDVRALADEHISGFTARGREILSYKDISVNGVTGKQVKILNDSNDFVGVTTFLEKNGNTITISGGFYQENIAEEEILNHFLSTLEVKFIK